MRTHRADIVVIGSGAGGAVVAQRLMEQGHRVVLLEAGSHRRTRDFTDNMWSTMKNLFWDDGFQYAPGRPTIPFLQGRAVGGTTVINSAISWDLPKEVHECWLKNDSFEIPYEAIALEQQRLRKDLNIHRVAADVLRGNNNVMQRGVERLGWDGVVVERNEQGCVGSGHCLMGCPHGAKLSMEATYIPQALEQGMELIANCEVERIVIEQGHVTGVIAKELDLTARKRKIRHRVGKKILIHTKRVVVSAGVIQTPLILQRSGVPDPHQLIGSHLMAHPGISIVGLFDEKIDIWNSATQGYEVNQFRSEGLKLESLGISPALFGMRLPHVGKRFAELYEQRAHMALWAVAIRTEAQGSVQHRRPFSPIRFSLTPKDVKQFLRGIELVGELLFAAGARKVFPGILGLPTPVASLDELKQVTRQPILSEHLRPVATHLFGTCRLSSDPRQGVIDANFQSHTVQGLYVADGSVFPSNTGVNPQLGIMALAAVAAKGITATA